MHNRTLPFACDRRNRERNPMSTNRYDLHFDKTIEIKNSVRLLYISSAKYGGDWHSTLHTHNCSELFYVTGGSGQFQIEDRIYDVSADDLIIIDPNVNHTEISLNSDPLEYIVVGAEGLELETNSSSDRHFRIISCRNFRDNIRFYLHQMLRESETKGSGYETICQDLMEILVIVLLRQTNFSTVLTPAKKNSTRLCTMVRRYIDTHYNENITLDLLTDMTHVSKYYLVHAFSEEYGVSPIRYVLTRRIEEARQLLKNDDYTLSFISRMLGFSSQSYFSQIFKKIVGVSPRDYRLQSQQESLDGLPVRSTGQAPERKRDTKT